MDQLSASGQFYEMPPIPATTLQKIIAGAKTSPELPRVAKAMLE
jgi:hypothetical protein